MKNKYMNYLKTFLLASLIYIFPNFVHAEGDIRLKNFRLASLVAIQDNGISYSTMVSWNPEYLITSRWSIGFHLGASVLETKERNDYLLTEYQLISSYLINPALGLELGYGRQNWLADGGSEASCSSGTFFYLIDDNAYAIDRIFLGYSYVAYPIMITREIKLGFGFSF